MFNIFKKHSTAIQSPAHLGQSSTDSQSGKSKSIILTLKGLHCSSCAVNIDLALEELPSVESTTSYAKSETKITYDPKQTSLDKIKSTLTEMGYHAD